MAKTSTRTRKTMAPAKKVPPEKLRDQILDHLQTLRVPMTPTQLDEALARAEREGLSHLQFVHDLLADQAAGRRQRSIERRIQQAEFRDSGTLENFDWKFNEQTIDRARFEEGVTGKPPSGGGLVERRLFSLDAVFDEVVPFAV